MQNSRMTKFFFSVFEGDVMSRPIFRSAWRAARASAALELLKVM